MPHEITMSAKFPSMCKVCGFRIEVGTWIKYDLARRSAIHLKCSEISYDGSTEAALFEYWVKALDGQEKAGTSE